MQWFNNLKVATKLLAAFGIVLALTAALGVFSIVQLERVNQTSTDMDVNWLPSTRAAGDMNTATSDFRAAELQHVLSLTEGKMASYEKELVTVQASLDRHAAIYAKLISSPQDQALFDGFKSSWAQYLEQHKAVLALSREGKHEEAKALVQGAAQQKFNDANAILTKLSDLNQAGGSAASHQGDELYAGARTAVMVLLAAAVALGVMLALFISRALVRQLGGEPGYAAAVAGKIAAGDLSAEVLVAASDNSSMMLAMKQMRDSLSRIVGDVRSGTDTIATASSQIACGNLDLSARTEEQASSLEETASSMEELTSTVKQSADNARQANSLATTASEVASKGGAVVAQVVDTMGEINASSRKISDIISVIDGIAFQTNILALNAAVEAARAGEQGRGFAVVATEVRNLAQRSAAAAKEIKILIGDSVEKVDTGSKLVSQAGETMNEIVDSVRRVTDIMGEILSAAQEQTMGIEQINEAISQMDQVTQQNAALVEEAAAASQSMQEQSATLAQTVSVFKLASRQAQVTATPAPAARAISPAPAAKPAAPAVRHKAAAPIRLAPRREPATAGADKDWEEF
ncbi:MCP four helix bundle domain-containing protein [Massilia sp. PAMC28688]|uniref:methyl-accepting chemotaxis protein n=1 Tax=Massilia sp. PAMC28688 TaxID=2861283 RepID=UPI001C631F79|nr:methyl-accepting chemotaxis protein [Massilia sp. PAMC28688]QYF95795.1 MCP four helix bundle domain-containing protein [Massilia sp. PAMC28688]